MTRPEQSNPLGEAPAHWYGTPSSDIATPAGGHEPEFVEWRWEDLHRLPGLVVPFKRPVYERVVAEFAHLAKP